MESSYRKDGNNALSLSSATDYYPYGMPMPGRSLTGSEGYRYAFQGQERDPETGKEAFELRLWDGRIGRWLTVDPMNAHYSPYVGMANNPNIFVDPNGGYPTPFEAVVMAAHVYGHKVDLIGGWKVSTNTKFNRNTESGLDGKLYERTNDDGRTEYAYVYMGSIGALSGPDWTNNAEQLWGNSNQYAEALKVSTKLSIALQQNELTFIGHSLGGGLANYSSLSTGRSSITFDPAWISKKSIDKINFSKVPLAFRNPVQQVNYIPNGFSLHSVQSGSQYTAADVFNLKSVGVNTFIGKISRVNILEVHNILNILNDVISSIGPGTDPDSRHTKSPRYF